MKMRRQLTLDLLTLVQELVVEVNGLDFARGHLSAASHAGGGGVEAEGVEGAGGVFATMPTLPSLQKACVVHLQLLNAALMLLPDDDAKLTADMLGTTIHTITQVLGSAQLMGHELGEAVYTTARAAVYVAGAMTQAVDWLRERGGSAKMCLELVRQFRKDMREAQLRAKLPRFVSQHVCADVPVANVRVTSAGIVRLLPAEVEVQQASAAGEDEIQADSFDDEEPFEIDPWLALEHNPLGVLKKRLASVPRLPRKKMRWEAPALPTQPVAVMPGVAATGGPPPRGSNQAV
jgi:hypothetical protein